MQTKAINTIKKLFSITYEVIHKHSLRNSVGHLQLNQAFLEDYLDRILKQYNELEDLGATRPSF